MSLSSQVIERFNSATQEILRPDIGLSNYTECAYAFLEKLLPCEFIVYSTLNVNSRSLELSVNHDIPGFEKAMESFGQIMAKYSLYNFDPSVNGGLPFARSDFFSRRQFREIDIFSEVYRPLGIDDHCAIHVPGATGEIPFFAIERKNGPDFSADERKMLEYAQMLLANARELAKTRHKYICKEAHPAALVRAGLTIREAEVLSHLAKGQSVDEIAIELCIRFETVKHHLKSIYQKIGVSDRLAAALWALETSREDEARATIGHLPTVKLSIGDSLPFLQKSENN